MTTFSSIICVSWYWCVIHILYFCDRIPNCTIDARVCPGRCGLYAPIKHDQAWAYLRQTVGRQSEPATRALWVKKIDGSSCGSIPSWTQARIQQESRIPLFSQCILECFWRMLHWNLDRREPKDPLTLSILTDPSWKSILFGTCRAR